MTNVRLRRLGAALKQARRAAGLTQAEVISATGLSKATLTRIENGTSRPQHRTLQALAALYADSSARLEALYDATDSHQPGWWEAFQDAIPAGFDAYISLEQSATDIRWYEPDLIPGLLQTEQYARAVLGFAPSDIERRVQLRLARQAHFSESKVPLAVLLGEGALMRSIGGDKVMRDQLNHLVDLSKKSDVSVRVIPFDRGMHIGLTTGGFTILDVVHDEPPVVYMEGYTGAVTLDSDEEVARFIDAFEALRGVALSEQDSRRLIRSRVEENWK